MFGSTSACRHRAHDRTMRSLFDRRDDPPAYNQDDPWWWCAACGDDDHGDHVAVYVDATDQEAVCECPTCV